MVQHRRVRAGAVGHLGQRWPQHILRPRHPQRGCVDHQELPLGHQVPAIPARGVQRAEQSDLERPEHDIEQPALRLNHQHEKTDAGTADRSEVRVLIPVRRESQPTQGLV